MENLKKNTQPTPKKLRDFNFLFAAVFGIIGGIMFWKGNPFHGWMLGIGALFLIAGLTFPRLSQTLYVVWMALATVLSLIMTHVILGLFFYLVITPIGLIFKLLGKRFFPWKPDPSATSYWIAKDPSQYNPKHFEKQFS